VQFADGFATDGQKAGAVIAFTVLRGASYPWIWKNLPFPSNLKVKHPGIPELINLQNVKGKAKPYQVKQLLKIAERYNLHLEEEK
jgi:hypothetical protein